MKQLPPLKLSSMKAPALLSAGVLLAGFLLVLPVARQAGPHWSWFAGMFHVSVFWLEAFTAIFLSLQAAANARYASLGWLAGGYAFSATVALALFFVFPGIVVTDLPGSVGNDTSVWLWATWHAGFPLFALLSVRQEWLQQRGPLDRPAPGARAAIPPMVGAAAAVLAVLGLVAFRQSLPPVIEGDDFTQFSQHPVGIAVAPLNLLALLCMVWVTGMRTRLQRWLAVSLLALALDAGLTVFSGVRYSVGWYTARCLSIVSASTLLGTLLLLHVGMLRKAQNHALAMQEEARRDALTGLRNRRFLMERMEEELERSRRHAYPLCVLMFDIDHFKKVNDTFGHDMGDKCLKVLANILRTRLRKFGDVAARLGGEEFVAVLPQTGLEGARIVAESIRTLVEEAHHLGVSPVPLTVSIGVAQFQSEGMTAPQDLLNAADHALYAAKEGGRNQVCLATHAGQDASAVTAAPAVQATTHTGV